MQNPAQFLFSEALERLVHDCVEAVELQTKIRPDLEEEELEEGEKWFVDSSSRVIGGKRKSGYTVVDRRRGKVIEAGPLNAGWSAQACELYAVLRALTGLKERVQFLQVLGKPLGWFTPLKNLEERGLINT